MKKSVYLFFGICCFVFCLQAQEKKQSKHEVMATIICQCLENESQESLADNFEEKFNDCYKASVLGALISQVPTDKDSTISLNADGSSDEITKKDRKKAFKILERDCEAYKGYIKSTNSYNQDLSNTTEMACDCISSISTSISTDEKNELITNCISEAVVASDVIEAQKLITVEDIKAYSLEVKRNLVDECEALKRVVFSNDEEKLFSYSSDKEATDFYNKGIDASEKGNYKKALKYYKKAVSIDDKFVYAWDNLGRTYRELHNYDKAIEAYKKSMAIDSLNPTPLMNIAVVYNYKKEFDNSAFWYNKLIEIDPENPEGHYGLSLAYMYSEKLESSLNSIITALKLYRKSQSPYVADAEKVMQYLYNMFEAKNEEDRFKEICKEQNINIKF